MAALFGGNDSPAPAPVPAAPAELAPPEPVKTREQRDGQRATGGGVTDIDNEVDELGNPRTKKRAASNALLG